MRIRRRKEQGLTLIEILVTAGLTAIVVGMSATVISSVQALWADQQERSAAARDGWLFVDKLCRELRESVPPAQLGEGAQWRGTNVRAPLLEAVSTAGWPETTIAEYKRQALEISDGAIRFPTLRVMAQGRRAEPGMVEYSLERDTSNHVVGISRRAAQMGVPPSAADHGVLSPSVVSLGFEYLGADGRWQTAWNDSSAIPRAVRISVGTLVRPSRRNKMPVVTRFSTLVYLPADSRIPQ